MTRKTLHDLFVHALSDVYSAEQQLTKALPKMARAASDPELSQAFTNHLTETEGQIDRIDLLVEDTGIKLKRIKCAAMEGLIEEGDEIAHEIERGSVRDAGLIAAAQKVEHYEIATYGTLCALASKLGMNQAVQLLQETLAEEKSTDVKLTRLAELGVNDEASAVEKIPRADVASLPRQRSIPTAA